MTNDVSNKTIAVLMVIVILVSVIGTWLVLDHSDVQVVGTSNDKGNVLLKIGQNSEGTDIETGNVKLQVT